MSHLLKTDSGRLRIVWDNPLATNGSLGAFSVLYMVLGRPF